MSPGRAISGRANRLQLLAGNAALQRRKSEAALAWVRHLGGWRQYGDQWEELLLQLVVQ